MCHVLNKLSGSIGATPAAGSCSGGDDKQLQSLPVLDGLVRHFKCQDPDVFTWPRPLEPDPGLLLKLSAKAIPACSPNRSLSLSQRLVYNTVPTLEGG